MRLDTSRRGARVARRISTERFGSFHRGCGCAYILERCDCAWALACHFLHRAECLGHEERAAIFSSLTSQKEMVFGPRGAFASR